MARRTLALAGLIALLGLAGCRKPAVKPLPQAVGSVRFTNVTAAAGVTFRHFTGADGRHRMPESVGPGGAFLDFDGDGWMDLFLVNSSNWPDRPASGHTGALYRNQHDGTFREVTREAGLAVPMFGQGCAVGDFDGDGKEDLLVTCVGPNHLFRNRGGRFQEVTRGSGLDDSPDWAWHTSAAWADYDRDGKLDLFVCRYVKWSPATDVACRTGRGERTYCGPQQYTTDSSELYRNLGDGKFRNVSAATGIAAVPGKGLGVLPLDENGDGKLDFLVTNDLVPNHLWRSENGGKFREVAQEAGLAVAMNGRPRAGMGVDAADVRNDGGLQFAIGNFAGESLALFDRSGPLYVDRASEVGLAGASLSSLTFGLVFLDADRDGFQDLLLCNGHVDPFAEDLSGHPSYRQRPQLFHNERGHFRDLGASAGPPFDDALVGRGCAWGDWDNDGRPDLLLCENAGPTRLLHNDSTDKRHWLGVRLRGKGVNRDAYGAVVRVSAGGTTQQRWVHSGSSYLSHSDSRALFGLGEAARVERLEIRWPSGKISLPPCPAVDVYVEIEEPR